MVLLDDPVHQLCFVGILHLAVSILGNDIGMVFVKFDAPLEEQLEMDAHGMDAGLHHDEITLRERF